MSKKRIGIFGGTFNPPHRGHIIAAEKFSKLIDPDEFIVIPSLMPPHKFFGEEATPQQRMEMCQIAFSHIKNVTVSDMEIKRGGKSYTYITLQDLYRDECELYMLCGTDMFITLDEWKNPEIIFNLATVCFVRRESRAELDYTIDDKKRYYKEKYNARIIEIPGDVLEISSTELRSSLAKGRESDYLSAEISDYIKTRNLYG